MRTALPTESEKFLFSSCAQVHTSILVAYQVLWVTPPLEVRWRRRWGLRWCFIVLRSSAFNVVYIFSYELTLCLSHLLVQVYLTRSITSSLVFLSLKENIQSFIPLWLLVLYIRNIDDHLFRVSVPLKFTVIELTPACRREDSYVPMHDTQD